jgi:hypothetical protein
MTYLPVKYQTSIYIFYENYIHLEYLKEMIEVGQKTKF